MKFFLFVVTEIDIPVPKDSLIFPKKKKEFLISVELTEMAWIDFFLPISA